MESGARNVQGSGNLDHITITRVVGLELTSRRSKLVGKNSRH